MMKNFVRPRFFLCLLSVLPALATAQGFSANTPPPQYSPPNFVPIAPSGTELNPYLIYTAPPAPPVALPQTSPQPATAAPPLLALPPLPALPALPPLPALPGWPFANSSATTAPAADAPAQTKPNTSVTTPPGGPTADVPAAKRPTGRSLDDLGRSLRNYFSEEEVDLLFEYMKESVVASFKGEEVVLPPDLAFKLEVLLVRLQKEGGLYMDNLIKQMEHDLKKSIKDTLEPKPEPKKGTKPGSKPEAKPAPITNPAQAPASKKPGELDFSAEALLKMFAPKP